MPTSQSQLIVQYANETFSNEKVVEASKCTKITRIALKSFTPCVAFFGRFPFAAICFKLGGHNYKGWALAAGNIASYTALISWALYNMVDDTMSTKSDTEKKLLRSSYCGTAAKITASFIIGTTAQLPFAYLAYQYNDKKIYMPILIIATDTIIPAYSSYLSMKQFSNVRGYVAFEKDLKLIRESVLQLLKGAKDAVLKLDDKSKLIVDKLKNVIEESGIDKFEQVLNILRQEIAVKHKVQDGCVKSTLIKVYQVGLLCMLAGDMVAIGCIGYRGWNAIDGNHNWPQAYGVGAAISVLANLYLFGMCIEETGNNILKLITGKYERTIVDRTLPVSSIVVKSLGCVTACLSWGPSVQVAKDYFDGEFSYWQQVTMSGATILLVLTAILDMLDAALEVMVQFSGNQQVIDAIACVDKLDKMIKIIEQAKPEDVQAFVNVISDDFKQALLSRLQEAKQHVQIEQMPLLT